MVSAYQKSCEQSYSIRSLRHLLVKALDWGYLSAIILLLKSTGAISHVIQPLVKEVHIEIPIQQENTHINKNSGTIQKATA